jgi:peptidoglycan/LPS O-acetylase OafA/YrhL
MIFVTHMRPPGFDPRLDSGVLIFFALSGYLLYRPFVDGPVAVGPYLVRRIARIMPAYLVAAFGIALLWHPDLLADPVGLATMTNSSVIVVWTLRIELTFYVALPVLAWALSRTRRPDLWIAWVAVGSLGLGALEMATAGVTPTGPLGWAWAFAPGMLVARPEIRARLAGVPTAALLTLGLGLCTVTVVTRLSYIQLPTAFGAALLIVALLRLPNLGGRASIALGAVSFSLYLWHFEILGAVGRTWGGVAIAFVVSIATAALIYLVVERPGIALGRNVARRLAAPSSVRLHEMPVEYVFVERRRLNVGRPDGLVDRRRLSMAS